MAAPSVTWVFSNGTTADGSQVNTNYNDIISGITDGSKDLTISALTTQGAVTMNGAVTLGNATGDDITITGFVASDIIPKTTASSDLGTTANTWSSLYLDTGATDGGAIYFNATTTSFLKSSADGLALNVEGFTSVDFPGALAFDMNGTEKLIFNSGATDGVDILGRTDAVDVSAGYIGEVLEATDSTSRSAAVGNDPIAYTSMSTTLTKELTAGVWLLEADVFCRVAVTTAIATQLFNFTVSILESTNVIVSQSQLSSATTTTALDVSWFSMKLSTVVNISSAKTYTVKIKKGLAGGPAETATSLTLYFRNDVNTGYIRGVRIA
jgi:hypothetical protein